MLSVNFKKQSTNKVLVAACCVCVCVCLNERGHGELDDARTGGGFKKAGNFLIVWILTLVGVFLLLLFAFVCFYVRRL